MNMRALLLGFVLLARLAGQDLDKLPGWAGAAAKEAAAEAPPVGADAWVVLERTEFAYRGDGEIRKRVRRLVRILTERGLDQGAYTIQGLGGDSSRVNRLKGWNLRPDGELTRQDLDGSVTVATNLHAPDVRTFTTLPRVAKGSWIAFESEETIIPPLGPVAIAGVLGAHPIRRWEFEMVTSVGWFTRTSTKEVGVHIYPVNFRPWFPEPGKGAVAIQLRDVPALPRFEAAQPDPETALPSVLVGFSDPSLVGKPGCASWDTLAGWLGQQVQVLAQPVPPGLLDGKSGLEALPSLATWIHRQINFRQVRLTPAGGWLPAPALEVLRKRIADGKDATCLYIGAARGAGLEAVPALCRVGGSRVGPADPVFPLLFDHMIAAVRLERSLGWPAEVETRFGRFLLVDPTSRFAEPGHLDPSFLGRDVLVCTAQGGAWVEVPAAAAGDPRLKVTIEAEETPEGRLRGTCDLEDCGQAVNLRQVALQQGLPEVHRWLAGFLDLPPGAALQLEPLGDPLEPGVLYKVRATFELPRALERHGAAWFLPRMGLPAVPGPIQRPGQARILPVQVDASAPLEWRAVLRLRSARPRTPAAGLETCLRTLAWKAVEADGAWTLTFRQETRQGTWPYERREEGVAAQRDDWKRYQLFLDEVLAAEAPR